MYKKAKQRKLSNIDAAKSKKKSKNLAEKESTSSVYQSNFDSKQSSPEKDDYNIDSHRDSNPEVTSGYKPLDTYDMDYVNQKIEEIKDFRTDFNIQVSPKVDVETKNEIVSPSQNGKF